MIVIVNADLGNTSSVANMIKKVGGESVVSSDPEVIRQAKKIILPGVGAFDAAMSVLRKTGIDDALRSAIADGARLLGICLGMQLLLEGSEEGVEKGLSFIQGRAVRFPSSSSLKVPHMGWNLVQTAAVNPLLPLDHEERRFYFVHSFHCECSKEDTIGVTHYGKQFVSAVGKGNIMGVQFHPEKSHRFGMELLKRYVNLEPGTC